MNVNRCTPYAEKMTGQLVALIKSGGWKVYPHSHRVFEVVAQDGTALTLGMCSHEHDDDGGCYSVVMSGRGRDVRTISYRRAVALAEAASS